MSALIKPDLETLRLRFIDADPFGLQITDEGIYVPDTATVREGVVNMWRAVYGQDLDVSSWTKQGQLIDGMTLVIDDKNNQLCLALNQFNPERNWGVWQEGMGKIYYLDKHEAGHTIVAAFVRGAVGTIIPKNSLVQDQNNEIYYLETAITIDSPSPIPATFIAVNPGPIVCPRGSLNRIYKAVPGWDTVINEVAGVTGSLEENRMQYEKRRRDSVAKNAHGNYSAIYGALADLTGVISVGMEENDTEFGRIMNGVYVPASGFFISVLGGDPDVIAQTIYERKDGGSVLEGNTAVVINIPTRPGYNTTKRRTIYFNRPYILPCRVKVTVATDTTYSTNNLEQLIKQRVLDAWNGVYDGIRMDIGGTVWASRFYCPVFALRSQYVFDIVQIKVARPVVVATTEDSMFSIDATSRQAVPKNVDPTATHEFWEYATLDNGSTFLRPKATIPPEGADTPGFWRNQANYLSLRTDIFGYEPGEWVDGFETTLNEYPTITEEDIVVEYMTVEEVQNV